MDVVDQVSLRRGTRDDRSRFMPGPSMEPLVTALATTPVASSVLSPTAPASPMFAPRVAQPPTTIAISTKLTVRAAATGAMDSPSVEGDMFVMGLTQGHVGPGALKSPQPRCKSEMSGLLSPPGHNKPRGGLEAGLPAGRARRQTEGVGLQEGGVQEMTSPEAGGLMVTGDRPRKAMAVRLAAAGRASPDPQQLAGSPDRKGADAGADRDKGAREMSLLSPEKRKGKEGGPPGGGNISSGAGSGSKAVPKPSWASIQSVASPPLGGVAGGGNSSALPSARTSVSGGPAALPASIATTAAGMSPVGHGARPQRLPDDYAVLEKTNLERGIERAAAAAVMVPLWPVAPDMHISGTNPSADGRSTTFSCLQIESLDETLRRLQEASTNLQGSLADRRLPPTPLPLRPLQMQNLFTPSTLLLSPTSPHVSGGDLGGDAMPSTGMDLLSPSQRVAAGLAHGSPFGPGSDEAVASHLCVDPGSTRSWVRSAPLLASHQLPGVGGALAPALDRAGTAGGPGVIWQVSEWQAPRLGPAKDPASRSSRAPGPPLRSRSVMDSLPPGGGGSDRAGWSASVRGGGRGNRAAASLFPALVHADADAVLNNFVASYRKASHLPRAATVISREWRRHRLQQWFQRFKAIRRRNCLRIIQHYFLAWRRLAHVLVIGKLAELRRHFQEWKGYCGLLDKLFRMLAACLERLVTRTQLPPVQLWRICCAMDDEQSAAKEAIAAANATRNAVNAVGSVTGGSTALSNSTTLSPTLATGKLPPDASKMASGGGGDATKGASAATDASSGGPVKGATSGVRMPSVSRFLLMLVQKQAPRRHLFWYLDHWRGYHRKVAKRRARAVAILRGMAAQRSREPLQVAFRFWFRWSQLRVARRTGLEVPCFRPILDWWDEYQYDSNRRLMLNRKASMLQCGQWMLRSFWRWKRFTAMGTHRSQAIAKARQWHVSSTKHRAFRRLLAMRNVANARRLTLGYVLVCWRRLTERNQQVRRIHKQLCFLSTQRRKVMGFHALGVNRVLSQIQNVATALRLLDGSALIFAAAHAFHGPVRSAQRWTAQCFWVWACRARRRVRTVTLLAHHTLARPFVAMRWAFDRWRAWTAAGARRRSAQADFPVPVLMGAPGKPAKLTRSSSSMRRSRHGQPAGPVAPPLSPRAVALGKATPTGADAERLRLARIAQPWADVFMLSSTINCLETQDTAAPASSALGAIDPTDVTALQERMERVYECMANGGGPLLGTGPDGEPVMARLMPPNKYLVQSPSWHAAFHQRETLLHAWRSASPSPWLWQGLVAMRVTQVRRKRRDKRAAAIRRARHEDGEVSAEMLQQLDRVLSNKLRSLLLVRAPGMVAGSAEGGGHGSPGGGGVGHDGLVTAPDTLSPDARGSLNENLLAFLHDVVAHDMLVAKDEMERRLKHHTSQLAGIQIRLLSRAMHDHNARFSRAPRVDSAVEGAENWSASDRGSDADSNSGTEGADARAPTTGAGGKLDKFGASLHGAFSKPGGGGAAVSDASRHRSLGPVGFGTAERDALLRRLEGGEGSGEADGGKAGATAQESSGGEGHGRRSMDSNADSVVDPWAAEDTSDGAEGSAEGGDTDEASLEGGGAEAGLMVTHAPRLSMEEAELRRIADEENRWVAEMLVAAQEPPKDITWGMSLQLFRELAPGLADPLLSAKDPGVNRPLRAGSKTGTPLGTTGSGPGSRGGSNTAQRGAGRVSVSGAAAAPLLPVAAFRVERGYCPEDFMVMGVDLLGGAGGRTSPAYRPVVRFAEQPIVLAPADGPWADAGGGGGLVVEAGVPGGPLRAEFATAPRGEDADASASPTDWQVNPSNLVAPPPASVLARRASAKAGGILTSVMHVAVDAPAGESLAPMRSPVQSPASPGHSGSHGKAVGGASLPPPLSPGVVGKHVQWAPQEEPSPSASRQRSRDSSFDRTRRRATVACGEDLHLSADLLRPRRQSPGSASPLVPSSPAGGTKFVTPAGADASNSGAPPMSLLNMRRPAPPGAASSFAEAIRAKRARRYTMAVTSGTGPGGAGSPAASSWSLVQSKGGGMRFAFAHKPTTLMDFEAAEAERARAEAMSEDTSLVGDGRQMSVPELLAWSQRVDRKLARESRRKLLESAAAAAADASTAAGAGGGEAAPMVTPLALALPDMTNLSLPAMRVHLAQVKKARADKTAAVKRRSQQQELEEKVKELFKGGTGLLGKWVSKVGQRRTDIDSSSNSSDSDSDSEEDSDSSGHASDGTEAGPEAELRRAAREKRRLKREKRRLKQEAKDQARAVKNETFGGQGFQHLLKQAEMDETKEKLRNGMSDIEMDSDDSTLQEILRIPKPDLNMLDLNLQLKLVSTEHSGQHSEWRLSLMSWMAQTNSDEKLSFMLSKNGTHSFYESLARMKRSVLSRAEQGEKRAAASLVFDSDKVLSDESNPGRRVSDNGSDLDSLDEALEHINAAYEVDSATEGLQPVDPYDPMATGIGAAAPQVITVEEHARKFLRHLGGETVSHMTVIHSEKQELTKAGRKKKMSKAMMLRMSMDEAVRTAQQYSSVLFQNLLQEEAKGGGHGAIRPPGGTMGTGMDLLHGYDIDAELKQHQAWLAQLENNAALANITNDFSDSDDDDDDDDDDDKPPHKPSEFNDGFHGMDNVGVSSFWKSVNGPEPPKPPSSESDKAEEDKDEATQSPSEKEGGISDTTGAEDEDEEDEYGEEEEEEDEEEEEEEEELDSEEEAARLEELLELANEVDLTTSEGMRAYHNLLSSGVYIPPEVIDMLEEKEKKVVLQASMGARATLAKRNELKQLQADAENLRDAVLKGNAANGPVEPGEASARASARGPGAGPPVGALGRELERPEAARRDALADVPLIPQKMKEGGGSIGRRVRKEYVKKMFHNEAIKKRIQGKMDLLMRRLVANVSPGEQGDGSTSFLMGKSGEDASGWLHAKTIDLDTLAFSSSDLGMVPEGTEGMDEEARKNYEALQEDMSSLGGSTPRDNFGRRLGPTIRVRDNRQLTFDERFLEMPLHARRNFADRARAQRKVALRTLMMREGHRQVSELEDTARLVNLFALAADAYRDARTYGDGGSHSANGGHASELHSTGAKSPPPPRATLGSDNAPHSLAALLAKGRDRKAARQAGRQRDTESGEPGDGGARKMSKKGKRKVSKTGGVDGLYISNVLAAPGLASISAGSRPGGGGGSSRGKRRWVDLPTTEMAMEDRIVAAAVARVWAVYLNKASAAQASPAQWTITPTGREPLRAAKRAVRDAGASALAAASPITLVQGKLAPHHTLKRSVGHEGGAGGATTTAAGNAGATGYVGAVVRDVDASNPAGETGEEGVPEEEPSSNYGGDERPGEAFSSQPDENVAPEFREHGGAAQEHGGEASRDKGGGMHPADADRQGNDAEKNSKAAAENPDAGALLSAKLPLSPVGWQTHAVHPREKTLAAATPAAATFSTRSGGRSLSHALHARLPVHHGPHQGAQHPLAVNSPQHVRVSVDTAPPPSPSPLSLLALASPKVGPGSPVTGDGKAGSSGGRDMTRESERAFVRAQIMAAAAAPAPLRLATWASAEGRDNPLALPQGSKRFM
eukprot:jgi/Mesvir1/14374/Mv09774-RA.1